MAFISVSSAAHSSRTSSGRVFTQFSRMSSSFRVSALVFSKVGMSPVKASPMSWIRHMRITLSMSASGNSFVSSIAIREIRQLCSATLSRRPEEV